MPTGGGKTICYVIPALAQPGLCVVVSPLLALMQDQVANLTARGVRAAQLSSALPAAQRAAVLEDLAGGGGGGKGGGGGGQPWLKLLLVTPELLAASERFRTLLRRLHATRNLSLFAIDESHCISTWGHDFRPAYRRLQALRRDFPGVPIMALTATAAAQVQDDICGQLRLSRPLRLLSSFNRPNISYTVRYLDVEEADEVEALVRLMRQRRQAAGGALPCSIVYCTRRDTCEAVAGRLGAEGLRAAAYHGQMAEATKKEVLRAWQGDEVPVVVATIAFGMGIDKAGVRLVVHLNLPRSLEGFYQEAGRAGRDGQPAESVLFYSHEARRRMDFVLQKDQEKKAGNKGRGKGGGGQDDADAGPGPGSGRGCGEGDGGGEEEPAISASAEETALVKASAWQAFGRVVDWATAAGCRRRALLAHFGEATPAGPCAGTGDGQAAGCDFCRDPRHVEAQLERLKALELEAATRRRCGGARSGGGGGDVDEEADMFGVRGGGSGGDGGVEEAGAGGAPGFINAGRQGFFTAAEAAAAAEARSAAAAARAAAGGRVDDKYFAALEAREREHERRLRSSGDIVDRMMAGGGDRHGAGGGGASASAAPPPDAAARANATTKLAAALAGNPACAGLDGGVLQQLTTAIESEVHGAGLPRQQYTSRMAGLLSRARAAPSALALLPQALQAAGTTAAAAAAVSPAAAATLLPALLQAEIAAVESGLERSAAGGADGGGRTQAVSRLRALASVAVTVGAVAAGGAGKRVNKLGRHTDAEVAEAARQVVASWKRQLPERPAGQKPPAD